METNCCSICFNEINKKNDYNGCFLNENSTFTDIIASNQNEHHRLICIHENQFHRDCIDKWLRRTPNCPLCRTNAANISKQNITPQTTSSMRATQYGYGSGSDRDVIVNRIMSLLRNYSNADTNDEKEYKKWIIHRMFHRYGLIEDERVCIAMAQHNIQIHM